MQSESFLYALPYVFLFLILLLLHNKEIKSNKPYRYQNIAFFLVLIFVGLRGHLYTDFISYYPYFEEVPTFFHLTSDSFGFNFEPGFVIYTSIIKTFCPNYYGWVFINTLIDLLVFRWFFKKYTGSFVLPLLFFIAFQGLFIEFNLFRNVKALDLFLISIPFLQRKKIGPYILLNLLGATMHLSSILYLPFYFFANKVLPPKILWFIIIISNIIFLFNLNFVSSVINAIGIVDNPLLYAEVEYYLESEEAYGLSIGHIERTLSIIICIILYNKILNASKTNVIFINCSLFYYVLFLVLSEVPVFAERVPFLFIFSYWVLFPIIFKLKFNNRKSIYFILILICFLKTFMANSTIFAYYENKLFGASSYEQRLEMVYKAKK